ncbi:hypothetical protein HDU91_004407, partial [Kappamyces sp. JEL0680]
VAIGAYQVPEIVFDVTPFLPILFDGKEHKIGFNVTTAANSYWLVDGNLKVWLDKDAKPDHVFNGKLHVLRVPKTQPSEKQRGSLASLLSITTVAKNTYFASGSISTSKGWVRTDVFKSFDFSNDNRFLDQGNFNAFTQTTNIYSSRMVSSRAGVTVDVEKKKYPLAASLNYTSVPSGAYQFDTTIDHGLEILQGSLALAGTLPRSLVSQKTLSVRQKSDGSFGTLFPGVGNQVQTYSLATPEQCYQRNIKVQNRTVVSDNSPRCSSGLAQMPLPILAMQ